MTGLNESLCFMGPSPWPIVIFSDLAIQIGTSVSQPIRCKSDDLMSGWVLYLMLDITKPPLPVFLLLLDNLLGYRGPTTAKPALCLDPTLGAWGPGWLQPGTMLLGRGIPSCPTPINSPESSVTSGEAGWTVRGAHLYHALGTSQVLASDRGLGSNRIFGAQGAHLDHPESRTLKLVDHGLNPTLHFCET